MQDPYEILGVPRDADETLVRQRYLELVRQHPPDRAPERFTEIRSAYEALRDPFQRIEAQLFGEHSSPDSPLAIAADIRQRLRNKKIPVSVLLSVVDS